MKYMILKSKKRNQKYRYKIVETIEASSLEVASDLVFKKFRKERNKENGETYIIVPFSKNLYAHKNRIPSLDGVPYCVVQYLVP
ncbi:hypothetical protein CVD27_01860 [Neobacillus cucumis]|uniref:Uncharacterized protein n=1 Tax=Neobacillus cucumis TaxID=1740721 RepID=A0A2N5HVQ8_9BACI|nr:hypothetical protein CVD27_01860 [Neobacillus cucumis]